MKPNYQALLDMARHAEERGVEMSDWFIHGSRDCDENECGTVGCLLGTYLVCEEDAVPELQLDTQIEWSARHFEQENYALNKHFGLSGIHLDWLFMATMPYAIKFQGEKLISRISGTRAESTCRGLELMTTEEAVRRLRKLIYFKLKQEEIHEAWNNRLHTRGAEAKNTGYVTAYAE